MKYFYAEKWAEKIKGTKGFEFGTTVEVKMKQRDEKS